MNGTMTLTADKKDWSFKEEVQDTLRLSEVDESRRWRYGSGTLKFIF